MQYCVHVLSGEETWLLGRNWMNKSLTSVLIAIHVYPFPPLRSLSLPQVWLVVCLLMKDCLRTLDILWPATSSENLHRLFTQGQACHLPVLNQRRSVGVTVPLQDLWHCLETLLFDMTLEAFRGQRP